jgi:endonuclease YncB( thermonuclease family)
MRWFALCATLACAVFVAVLIWPTSAPGRGPIAQARTTIPPARAGTFTCTVTKVHDGDGPIWCAEGPKIRLTAIAAREMDESCSPGHPCPNASGSDAQRELEGLALGRVLQCEQTGMSYKRVTAWCWREDGLELNCAMVKSGKALRWHRYDPRGRLCA